jgi:hypothetical protein
VGVSAVQKIECGELEWGERSFAAIALAMRELGF